MIITLAIQRDLINLVDMQESHREEIAVHSSLTFDRGLCIENMRAVIDSNLHIVLVVHDKVTSKLIGYMWLCIFQPHYSREFYLSEVYTYVLPERRKSSVLSRLINKAKVISLNMGAGYLQVGSFSGDIKLSLAYHKRYDLVGEVFNINLRG